MTRQASRKSRGSWMVAVAATATLFASGCATEPKPLDKTQPESIHKSVFQGEWYFNMTVTDTEWHNWYTFIGEQPATYYGAASKLRWEITQDHLNAYMIPQRYLDPDGNLVEDPNAIGRESLVLSFRIEKHFDIKYQQNNTTREELNVIIENTTDRPWYEREYVMVDWSQNLAANLWAPLQLDAETGELIREPVSTWKNVEFFDVTNRKVNTKAWRPGKDPDIYAVNIDLQEQIHSSVEKWWHIYYGWVMEPAVVRYRFSLMKKDPEGLPPSEYQPLQYRDEYFRRFGFFRTEYETYDPDRGPLESQKQYLANRWDVGCYDDPDFGHYCKKIVFYMSPSMPTREEDPDLYEWTLEAVNAWNSAFQEATGREDQVVVLQENEPLVDEDGNPVYDSLGKQRYKYELGDIRYSFINYITKPGSYTPLGYGPSTPDPDTGEIISATVNVYGNWLDYIVTRAIDLYDVVAGNCTLEDIMEGHFYNEESGLCDGGNPGITAKDNAGKRVDFKFLTPAMQTAHWPKGRINKPTQPFNRQHAEAMRPLVKQYYYETLRDQRPADLGKFSIAAGTRYEDMMVPSATFTSTFPGAETVDQVLSDWSPAYRLSENRLWEVRNFFEQKGRHCTIEPDDYENVILAFIEEMAGKPRDEVKQTLRKWIYYTTVLHEMGHTLGLRHNFRGSVDKANFPAEFHVAYNDYWDQVEALREQFGDAIKSGDASAYRQYVDAVHRIPSKHERYAGTSIMDYAGDWEMWIPLPSYDRAAILFGYGNKIEVSDGSRWVLEDYQDGDFVKDDVYNYAQPSASGRVVRYYMTCSDERIFDDMFCMWHDRGVNATEIIRNMIRDQYKSYFFTNFKRDSTMFDSRRSGYYWRKWIRLYYFYAKAFAQITVHSIWYDEFWDTLWDGLEGINDGPEARDMEPGYTRTGGEDLLRASLLYYYYLLYDVLQRPDYGLYELIYDPFGNRFWESTEPQYTDQDSITASVDPGPGWGWVDKWDSQYDTTIYYDKLIRIGVELDKIIAYEILSIPAALNEYLWHEKANGNTYWSDLWTANGMQLWKITRAFITDTFAHDQNPWCMDMEGNLTAYPIDLLEGAATADFIEKEIFSGQTRCGPGEYPVQGGMDALYAIYPIFYGISGSQHPWYHNHLSDYMDSQVKGGNHRFDIPDGAEYAEFVNSTGSKTYQAVQTEDGLSISYQLVDKGRRISNRIRLVQACDAGEPPPTDPDKLIGTYNRTCEEVLSCYSGSAPSWCAPEDWNSLYILPTLAYRDLDRVEAMLIMMQDMIDLAGHYAWRTPGYLEEP